MEAVAAAKNRSQGNVGFEENTKATGSRERKSSRNKSVGPTMTSQSTTTPPRQRSSASEKLPISLTKSRDKSATIKTETSNTTLPSHSSTSAIPVPPNGSRKNPVRPNTVSPSPEHARKKSTGASGKVTSKRESSKAPKKYVFLNFVVLTFAKGKRKFP